jgi:hypothetical protein
MSRKDKLIWAIAAVAAALALLVLARAVGAADVPDLVRLKCGTCHALSHALGGEKRDEEAWRKLLADPSHRAAGLTEAQREEIARYAAANLPLNPGDTASAR